jgi:hypothetical protein
VDRPFDGLQAGLSVVVVIGDRRDRARRMLAALAAQTACDRLEIILVDASSDGAPALSVPPELKVRRIRATPGIMPGRARFMGAEIAQAPWVAFLEDHCYPEPGWAAAILAAHREGWTAAGYSFINGSPDTYLFRSIFLAEYGPWAHPQPGGAAVHLPGSNVSYQRSALMRFGERLSDLLEVDYALHESLRNEGASFCTAAGALVAHESYARFRDLLYAHFLFCRLQAARRAQAFAWPFRRRLVISLVAPIALPALQLFRAWKVFRRHRLLTVWLAAIPVIYAIHQAEAIGESLGLLLGAGESPRRFAPLELNSRRAAG